jgi:hypothetical protein
LAGCRFRPYRGNPGNPKDRHPPRFLNLCTRHRATRYAWRIVFNHADPAEQQGTGGAGTIYSADTTGTTAQPWADRHDLPGGPVHSAGLLFDTVFRRSQSPMGQSFAIPRWLTVAGVPRCGFRWLYEISHRVDARFVPGARAVTHRCAARGKSRQPVRCVRVAASRATTPR